MMLSNVVLLLASGSLMVSAFDCSRYGAKDTQNEAMMYADDYFEESEGGYAEPFDYDFEGGGNRKLQLQPVEMEDFTGQPWQHATSCDTVSSNARGHYSSNFLTCKIRFHKSDTPDTTSILETSTFCGDDNALDSLDDYVIRWRDECVADFTRCYIIERDERIYLNTACRRDWDFPEGATHISVNCEEDNAARLEYFEANRNRQYDPESDLYWKRQQEQQEEQIRELEKVVFSILFILILSCLCCCGMFYWCGFKPYHNRLKARRERVQADSGGVADGAGITNAQIA